MRTQVKNQQRSVADRTDVLTFTTPVLTTAMRIRGAPVADLFAATSGADSDWVVKLIDVFPDEVPNQPSPCAIPCARGPSRASAIGIPKSRIFSMPVACLESDAAASGLAAIPWLISLKQALFAGKQCERPDGTASRYFGGAVASGKRTPEP